MKKERVTFFFFAVVVHTSGKMKKKKECEKRRRETKLHQYFLVKLYTTKFLVVRMGRETGNWIEKRKFFRQPRKAVIKVLREINFNTHRHTPNEKFHFSKSSKDLLNCCIISRHTIYNFPDLGVI